MSREPIALGKLNENMSQSEVKALFGEPVLKVEQLDFVTDIYIYKNITVEFNGIYVVGASTESSEICTTKQLCTGDSVDRLIQVYGQPTDTSRGFYEYYEKNTYSCWYRFTIRDNQVQAISIACQP